MSVARCEGVFGAFDHGKGEIGDKHILAVQQTSKDNQKRRQYNPDPGLLKTAKKK